MFEFHLFSRLKCLTLNSPNKEKLRKRKKIWWMREISWSTKWAEASLFSLTFKNSLHFGNHLSFASVIFAFGEQTFLCGPRVHAKSRARFTDTLCDVSLFCTFVETTAVNVVNSCASSFWDLWQQDFFVKDQNNIFGLFALRNNEKET